MKEWLAVDFHEERKWKMALAHHIAKLINQYHSASDKSLFCKKV